MLARLAQTDWIFRLTGNLETASKPTLSNMFSTSIYLYLLSIYLVSNYFFPTHFSLQHFVSACARLPEEIRHTAANPILPPLLPLHPLPSLSKARLSIGHPRALLP